MPQKHIVLTGMTGVLTALIGIAALVPGAATPSKKSVADASTALVSQGHALFLTNCSPCHGANAQGDDGPNLHHKNLADTFIASSINSGFKDEMPPFRNKLKALEVKALTAYVHSLQK